MYIHTYISLKSTVRLKQSLCSKLQLLYGTHGRLIVHNIMYGHNAVMHKTNLGALNLQLALGT